LVYSITRRIKKASRDVRKKESELVSIVEGVFSSIRVVKAFAREDYEERHFERQSLENVEITLVARSIKMKLSRSTLANANEHRPWTLFQSVFFNLYQRCQSADSGRQKKVRSRNPLLTIDGTLIDLCSSVFNWVTYQREKGAAKIDLVLDNRRYVPKFAVITDGNASDLIIGRSLQFEAGTILIITDRGYIDYQWYQQLTHQGGLFVTGMRKDAYYIVKEERQVPRKGNIPKDELI
jgi:hypothetical protein